MRSAKRLAWALLCAAALASCGEDEDRFTPARGVKPQTTCKTPGLTCDGDVVLICNEKRELTQRDCGEQGMICATGVGCANCVAKQRSCEGNVPRTCRDDGSGWDSSAACDSAAGLQCSRETGSCVDLCARAEDTQSYIGCDYWPTVTANRYLDPQFTFAVAVSNPQAVPAQVQVSRAGDPEEPVAGPITVEPDELTILPLPWIPELMTAARDGQEGSLLVPSAAYHLTSDVPVTVVQFNALEYRIDRDCDDEPEAVRGDERCYSYTNDASLLVPSHVLTGNYMVTTRESQLSHQSLIDPTGAPARDGDDLPIPGVWSRSPGFVTVTAVDDDVQVTLALRAGSAGAPDGTLPPRAAGEAVSARLRRGDVLQVLSAMPPEDEQCTGADELHPLGQGYTRRIRYCDVGRDFDFTGTRIAASGKVSVLAGHSCALVPFNRLACDHLEESMFPMETWGSEFVVATTHALRVEPNVIRLLAAQDGTEVRFEPEVHDPVTLGRGEFLEFEFMEDFLVHSSGPLSVGQYLVGQEYGGLDGTGSDDIGDPAFALVAPAVQYRSYYNFLAPETYTENWITVVAPLGQRVELDGRAVSRWTRIGATDMQSARVPVRPGSHTMRSDRAFGVTVYGFGSYTSYMYTAGLDFQKITAPQ